MDKSSTLSNQRLRVVVANGLIMALYVAVTVLVAPVASGAIQFRVSEGLNHLVVFNRKLMWGVLAELYCTIYFWYGNFGRRLWWRPNLACIVSNGAIAEESSECLCPFSA